MLRLLTVVILVVNQVQGFNEWSSWTLCDAGCQAERTRSCEASTDNLLTSDTCEALHLVEEQPCSSSDVCRKGATTTILTVPGGKPTIVKSSPEPSSVPDKKNKQCCGCLFKDKGVFKTSFRSSTILCTWNFKAEKNHKVAIEINVLENVQWKAGASVWIASPKRIIHIFRGENGSKEFDRMEHKRFESVGNEMNLTLVTHSSSDLLDPVVMQFSYHSYPQDKEHEKVGGGSVPKKETQEKKKGLNVPLVASIIACVVVILFASIFLGYRKFRRSQAESAKETEDEKAGFFGGGNRPNKLTSPRKDRTPGDGKVMPPPPMALEGGGGMQLIDPPKEISSDGGYLSGGDQIFYPQQQPTFITALPPTTYIAAGQQYINWPLPGFASQMNFPAYKQSFEQITPTNGPVQHLPLYYPTSGGEG